MPTLTHPVPGKDWHRENAAKIFKVSSEAVTPEQRLYAKRLAYIIAYTPPYNLTILTQPKENSNAPSP